MQRVPDKRKKQRADCDLLIDALEHYIESADHLDAEDIAQLRQSLNRCKVLIQSAPDLYYALDGARTLMGHPASLIFTDEYRRMFNQILTPIRKCYTRGYTRKESGAI